MPRVGQFVLQEYPHHIVQRGHNRQVIFAQMESKQTTFVERGIAQCPQRGHTYRAFREGALPGSSCNCNCS